MVYTKLVTMENSPTGRAVTVNEILNSCSFSWFTIKLTMITSLFWFLSISEITMTSVVAPYLQCEWNIAPLSLSILSASIFLGNGIGAIYFGRISDVYGRKFPMFFAALFTLYFLLLEVAAPNFLWYGLLRLVVGILTGGLIVSSATFMSEFTGSKHRGKAVGTMSVMCSVGNLYTGLMAYLTLNTHGWRIFLLLSVLPFIFIFVSIEWFPESIRFLQVTGNHTSVLETLYNVCEQNNKTLPAKINLHCNYTSQKGNFAILTGNRFLKKLVLLICVWVVTLMTYYSTTFLTVFTIQDIDLQNETFTFQEMHWDYRKDFPHVIAGRCPKLTERQLLENMLITSSEIPGAVIYLLLVDYVGRKPCLIFGFLYLAFVYVLQIFQLPTTFSLFLLLSGRAIGYGSTAVLFIFTLEHFPTIVRSTGLGLCNTISRWSLIFIPFLFQYFIYTSFFVVILIIVALNIIGCVLCCQLTETLGQILESE